MKTFVLHTSSSDENFNGDHDYAVVEIDDVGLRRLKSFRKVWRLLRCEAEDVTNDHGIGISLEFTWFYNWPDFYSRTWEEDWPSEFEELGVWQAPAPFKPETEAERTECTRMHVCRGGVYWTTIPKHTDLLITTEEISWVELGVDV
jgi:hypothetical protein